MEREEFMQEARMTARRILEGKENGIMNLVHQAWAEGKRNAEVEALRAAIDEALDRREPKAEPVADAIYPTWGEWLTKNGVILNVQTAHDVVPVYVMGIGFDNQIPADIAQKLGIEPKEGDR